MIGKEGWEFEREVRTERWKEGEGERETVGSGGQRLAASNRRCARNRSRSPGPEET